MKKRKIVILDPGHGGINPITCQYETAPKKMFVHPEQWYFHDGSKFYEGVFNRSVVKRLMQKLALLNIPYFCTVPPFEFSKDISLRERVKIANNLSEKFDCIYISFHANAFRGTARGYELHYDFEDLESKKLANEITLRTKEAFADVNLKIDNETTDVIPSGLKFRSNKNSPRLYVIRKTRMPSVLIEHGFFDNIDDANILIKHENIDLFADATCRALITWFNNYL